MYVLISNHWYNHLYIDIVGITHIMDIQLYPIIIGYNSIMYAIIPIVGSNCYFLPVSFLHFLWRPPRASPRRCTTGWSAPMPRWMTTRPRSPPGPVPWSAASATHGTRCWGLVMGGGAGGWGVGGWCWKFQGVSRGGWDGAEFMVNDGFMLIENRCST